MNEFQSHGLGITHAIGGSILDEHGARCIDGDQDIAGADLLGGGCFPFVRPGNGHDD